MIVRRSPIAGLVTVSSGLENPTDLPGRRVGGPRDGRLVAEFVAALRHLGLGDPTLVDIPYADAPAALGRGEVEVVPDFIDLVPRTRRQAGVPIRGIHLGIDIYGSGLVAADSVPDHIVERMCNAVEESLRRQRVQPERGLTELVNRYPDVDRSEALEGWRLLAPQVFTGEDLKSMDSDRWRRTVEYATGAHSLVAPELGTVFRDRTVAGHGIHPR